jgi:hypothetical protein
MEFLSKPAGLTNASPRFEPCQIVCLEYETSRLYGEVVQIAEQRQVCWVRPLLLTVAVSAGAEQGETEPCIYDLRRGSDLLLPVVLFRAALDVEVIPLFPHLYSHDEADSTPFQPTGHQQLRQLIQKIWNAYPDVFQA